jgi:hypothetical protein
MPRDAWAEVDSFAVYSAFDRCHRALGTLRKHGSSLSRRLRSSRTADVTFFRSHDSLRFEEAVGGHKGQSVLEHRSVVEVGDLQVHQIPHVLLLSQLAVNRQRLRELCLILRTQNLHAE